MKNGEETERPVCERPTSGTMKYLLSFSRNAEEKLVVERNICLQLLFDRFVRSGDGVGWEDSSCCFHPFSLVSLRFQTVLINFWRHEIRNNKTKMGENGISRSFPFPRVRIDSRIGCSREKSRNEGGRGRGGPNVRRKLSPMFLEMRKGFWHLKQTLTPSSLYPPYFSLTTCF